MRAASTGLVLVLSLAQLGATDCDGTITRDPGFDLWCGDALCAWKLERGDVRRVPTWHAADAGVALGDTTAIEQFTPVTDGDGACIRFDLVADVAETAQVELGVDVYGDGTVERSFPVPTARWAPVSFRFAVRPPFTGLRFELAKRGVGRAVVARMRAAVVRGDGCAGVPELTGGPAPLGARCAAAADCASAICAPVGWLGGRFCAGCDPARASCGGGQVCGRAEPGPAEREVPVACVAAAARALGEQCLGGAECASGICTGGVCSSCEPTTGCGAACQPAYEAGPSLCSPGSGRARPGAPCATHADCASGSCRGAPRRQCVDGRACASDASCPVGDNLVPGPCETVGIQGGSCD